MGLPFRQQILDLKLIESVDEEELTLEESGKIVGGLHYSIFTHPYYSLILKALTDEKPIKNPPGKNPNML